VTVTFKANASGLQWLKPCYQAFSQTDLRLATQTQLFQEAVVLVLCRCQAFSNSTSYPSVKTLPKNLTDKPYQHINISIVPLIICQQRSVWRR